MESWYRDFFDCFLGRLSAAKLGYLAPKYCKKGIIQVAWVVEFLNQDIKGLLDDFPRDIRASFERIAGLI